MLRPTGIVDLRRPANCFQHAILLPKKLDHLALLALEPSEQRGEEHLERKHAVSLRQCVARVFRHFYEAALSSYPVGRSSSGLYRQTSSERAQPSHPAQRDGHANGSRVVSLVVKRRSPPRRGEVAHPFMRALNGTVRAGAR